MSLAYPLAVYASVCAHLGERMDFPADINHWQNMQRNSSAMLDAYFEEWLVLTDGTANQKFNATDGTVWAWEMLWPRTLQTEMTHCCRSSDKLHRHCWLVWS